jgi:hypothetical protein
MDIKLVPGDSAGTVTAYYVRVSAHLASKSSNVVLKSQSPIGFSIIQLVLKSAESTSACSFGVLRFPVSLCRHFTVLDDLQ